MKTLAAIAAACLMASLTVTAAEATTPPIFQIRLVVDAPTSDSEPMTLPSSSATPEVIQVQKAVLLDQTALKSARAQTDSQGRGSIAIKFSSAGSKKFAEITRA